ncbi:hypothetical protein B9G39_29535 [Zooshikella ganghwensis]|uniref:Uncharacterized protein n=1 Tax=Zooshikella ganghwensis TaxID=202772 RepID=A0A4P9VDW2_9GAMM|nr:hypothetical protein B9G39_29535 [Zooshikella ganghwensis]
MILKSVSAYMVDRAMRTILILMILLPLTGCWYETSADSGNPYENLVGKEFVVKTILYRDEKQTYYGRKSIQVKLSGILCQKELDLK